MGGARGPEQAVVQEALGRRMRSGVLFTAPTTLPLSVLSLWFDTRNTSQKFFV